LLLIFLKKEWELYLYLYHATIVSDLTAASASSIIKLQDGGITTPTKTHTFPPKENPPKESSTKLINKETGGGDHYLGSIFNNMPPTESC